jgi:molybdopterin-containing oxidoreductase family iron-sulfur binding subunit
MRGQAALQGLYNPDRIKTPLLKDAKGWKSITFGQAEALLKLRAEEAAQRGNNRVRMLTEVTGDSLMNLMSVALERWNSSAALVFETYAYESLRTANQNIFGVDGLPSYRLEQADLLVSFGADFLETWLSPVEYARRFKEMHEFKGATKGLFFHLSPYQSLTGANADLWLSCSSGGEAAVALGLLRVAVRRDKGRALSAPIRTAMERVSEPFTPDRVSEVSGVKPEEFDKLLASLSKGQKPLVLGTGAGPSGPNTLQTNLAVNLLNVALDPDLALYDFTHTHRIEKSSRRSEVQSFFENLSAGSVELLLLNNVNPVYSLPPKSGVRQALERDDLFIVSFSNYMEETTEMADLVLPVQLPLETWDEYGGKTGIFSTLQPTMGSLTGAPSLGDLFLRLALSEKKVYKNYQAYLFAQAVQTGMIQDKRQWLDTLQHGGVFGKSSAANGQRVTGISREVEVALTSLEPPLKDETVFIAAPSVRLFDGRGANKPWLCEIPDPLTKVAWQPPILVHPETLSKQGLQQGNIVQIESRWGSLEAPVYETVSVRQGLLVMQIGQGHVAYGRYAKGVGLNPIAVLTPDLESGSGAPFFTAGPVTINRTGRSRELAHTDGSRLQHDRKIALSVDLKEASHKAEHKDHGYGMWEFPFTLPLPQGYDRERDFYPPHEHKDYRWAMVVDLDKCIGCGACSAACYAENSLGVVGEKQMLEGREMAWLQIQRYEDPQRRDQITFLPMLCQHCDNAPCESVCPVFAPHHSTEGLNNQIYNRCIGTRFCSQDCPYKVRRFNWYDWQWPDPLSLQLNPDVTVRSKGVMEKCSFCIQRIKAGHNKAKNEDRKILDGEVQPACLQTCPTGVFTFGNLVDKESQVWKKVHDPRAYQIMGYLNAKPAVIYLKKVVQEI